MPDPCYDILPLNFKLDRNNICYAPFHILAESLKYININTLLILLLFVLSTSSEAFVSFVFFKIFLTLGRGACHPPRTPPPRSGAIRSLAKVLAH